MARWMRKCGWKVRTGLVSGVAMLLLVDVIWVGSAGLTRFLFIEEAYEKPFFTTYFKTTLFSIYLVAFLFWRPWQRQCWKEVCVCGRGRRRQRVVCTTDVEEGQRAHHHHHGIQQQDEDESCVSPLLHNDSVDVSSRRAHAPLSPSDSTQQHKCQQNTDSTSDHSNCTHNSCSPSQDLKSGNGAIGREEFQQCTEFVREGEEEESSVQDRSRGAVSSHHVVQKKLFDVSSLSGSVNQAVCSIRPKMDVCLLGPPEFEPIGCCDSDDEEDRSSPLSPCHHKDCKVRFNTTIEVRERMGVDCQRHNETEPIKPLSVWKVMGVALVFGILWFFANYLYALGLDKTTVAAVNTISAVSGVFVMMLAAIPILSVTEGDKFTLSRLMVTLVSVGGAVMVSLSPSGLEDNDKKFNYGAIFALGGAALYALYLVLLKKVVQHHAALDIPMFFGFVGLFDFLLLLPLVLIWDITDMEQFELPPTPNVWTLLLVNGFVGTVLSELLWLWAVFLTSPLLGTLALSLVTPLSIAYSIVVGKASFSWLFFFGAVLIIIAFIGVTILDHFGAWDPLWVGMKKLFIMAKDSSRHRGYRSLSPESRRLISTEQQTYCDPEYIIT